MSEEHFQFVALNNSRGETLWFAKHETCLYSKDVASDEKLKSQILDPCARILSFFGLDPSVGNRICSRILILIVCKSIN
jgi:hypothetical protein